MRIYKIFLRLFVLVSIGILILVGNMFGQHRVQLNPLNGNVSYSYPITSRSINGASVNFGLTYSSNVTQISFGEYTPPSFEHVDWGALIPEKWVISTRMHGVWMMSINGFVVQTLSVNPVDPSAETDDYVYNGYYEPYNQQWFTKGYDACSRLCIINEPTDQDVINILQSDGSILELRNETTYSDEPADLDLLYTGRYYPNHINSTGFAIVEYDDTYWPSTLRYMFDTNGTPDRSLRPRVLRYYPGDGLEYVFREIAAPWGDPRECLIQSLSYNDALEKRTVGVTIFYLEEINQNHKNIVTVTRSKHYPSDNFLDIAPGRALLKEFSGHFLDYGDDLVTIQAEGKTHKLIFNQQDRYGTVAVDSTYHTYRSSFDTDTSQFTRIFPTLGDRLRYINPNDLAYFLDLGTLSPQHVTVKEIISPAG